MARLMGHLRSTPQWLGRVDYGCLKTEGRAKGRKRVLCGPY